MISFDEAALAAFLTRDDGGPVVMLNPLRIPADGGRQERPRPHRSTPPGGGYA